MSTSEEELMRGYGASPDRAMSLTPRRLAVLCAACLLIDDARLYGLIDSAPDIDRARCNELLGQLRQKGIVPESDEISQAALGLMTEIGVLRR